jgi:bifunctional oligoribonuclease and PAP phosphatase NrnA
MFSNAINLINNAKSIAVFCHINPDGDALGSSIALKLGLEKLGKKVDVYCDDTIHDNYRFLGTDEYYKEHNCENYDLAIIVDCPDINRIGGYGSLYSKIKNKMVIDHHLNNSINADVSIIDVNAGSVGVIVFRLFKVMQIEVDKQIATALYTAISTDTGCFMHGNTTSEAHFMVAELIEKNIELEKVNFYLFKRKTKSQITLFAKVINNIQYHEDNKIALVVIDKEDFLKTKTNYIDTIGISAYLAGIDDIDVAVLVTETEDNCYLISFRSNKINTSLIAREFKGGGHANASGCRICGKKENVINKLLEACRKELV